MHTDPKTIPAKVWRDSEVIYLPQWQRYDNAGNLEPLVNSADGLFPKPIVKPVSIGLIHANVWKDYDDAAFKNEINTTNSVAWRGWEPGQAWVSRIITEDEETNEQNVAKVHYIIRCIEFGWDNDMIQMGYWHNNGGDKTAFTTVDGVPYVGMLDGTGAEGGPEIAGDELHRRIDFSTLGF